MYGKHAITFYLMVNLLLFLKQKNTNTKSTFLRIRFSNLFPSLVLWILLYLIEPYNLVFFCNSVYWRQRSTAGRWPSWSMSWCYSHSITLWPPLRLVAASTLTSTQMEDIRSGRPRSAVTAFVTLPMATVAWRRCLGTSRWGKGKFIQRFSNIC